jgi:Na+-driven multidrug efflux pump
VATLAANGLNVVLGFALIFGAGLGVRGAAIATVVSQVSIQRLLKVTTLICTTPLSNPREAHSDSSLPH